MRGLHGEVGWGTGSPPVCATGATARRGRDGAGSDPGDGAGTGRGQIRFLVSSSRATRDYRQWKTKQRPRWIERVGANVINGETRASPAGRLLFNCRNLIRRPNTVRSTKPNHARRANAAGETCQTPDTRSDPEADRSDPEADPDAPQSPLRIPARGERGWRGVDARPAWRGRLGDGFAPRLRDGGYGATGQGRGGVRSGGRGGVRSVFWCQVRVRRGITGSGKQNNGLARSNVSAHNVINGEARASPSGRLLFNCRNLIRRPNTVRSTKPNHARRANAAGETCQTPDTRSDPEALTRYPI